MNLPSFREAPAAAARASPAADLLDIFRSSEAGRRIREMLAAMDRPPDGPGGRIVRIGAVRGSSLGLILSALRRDADPPAILIVPTIGEEEDLVDALDAFGFPRVLSFPPWDLAADAIGEIEAETCRERIEVLRALAGGARGLAVVAPVQSLLQPVPPPAALRAASLRLARGVAIEPGALARRLVDAGFRRLPLVERRGDFAARGGILDIFPYDGAFPVRIEFLGDAIDGLREFNPVSQRSVRGLDGRDIVLLPRDAIFRPGYDPVATALPAYLPLDGRVVWCEPADIRRRAEKQLAEFSRPAGKEVAAPESLYAHLRRFPTIEVTQLPVTDGPDAARAGMGPVDHVRGDLDRVSEAIRLRIEAGGMAVSFWETDAEGKRFAELLADRRVASDRVRQATGRIRRGFDLAGRALVLAGGEILDRQTIRRAGRPSGEAAFLDGFLQIEEGDLVVHVAHGIGRFRGIRRMVKGGRLQEFLTIEYRGGVHLHVPVSRADLVQKYIGSGDRAPTIDRLGGTSWRKRKEAVEEAVMDLAVDLLEIQARRLARPGIAFPADDEWQRTFEASFPFDDTPDQAAITAAVKADMQVSRPMDRLICGDVGYGKTEIAMRAAFKCVMAGKQVAVLVPTTVLADQHARTFRERMAEFPVRIESLSRFRTPAEQRRVIEGVWSGEVDILIGTHRILSDDVAFRDLGLVVTDEEQRFGVAHKEKLKRMRETVDVLTLTATPIPRTLHMALLGIRDISALATAPEGRSSIRTEVTTFEDGKIREIILRELARDGQVYMVHNRIHDIDAVARRIRMLVPEARVEIGHGQMPEGHLARVMRRFVSRAFDVLVSTTIIESGLDIPNVNTIIIDDADTYGLADLHQLRGRVGRYKHQAYAYLLLPAHREIHPDAEKRLRAIEEFSHLGAGFQIALRDLEIRGAGNILGAEQSGHIATVGYDLYCQLLDKAVRALKGDAAERAPERPEVEIDLDLEAYLPDEYVPHGTGRIDLYRRIARTGGEEILDGIARELEDRFGPLPAPAAMLLDLQRLRIRLASLGIEKLERDGPHVTISGPRIRARPGRHPLRPLADGKAAIRSPDPARTPEDALRIALEWAAPVDLVLAGR